MTSQTVNCFIAQTPESLEQVYRLRYECYRRKESIGEREDKQFRDSFDEKPNTFNFLVSDRERALATLRLCVVAPKRCWMDSPVCNVYGDDPAFQQIQDESFVEASRLCFGEQARSESFIRLLGNMAALAEFYGVAWLVACPRVEHSMIYQRMFGFRPLSTPRQYFGVNFQTQLLGIRVRDLRRYVRNSPPMMAAWGTALVQLNERSKRRSRRRAVQMGWTSSTAPPCAPDARAITAPLTMNSHA